MKVGHFGNFFSKGVKLKKKFGNRVRKKKKNLPTIQQLELELSNKLQTLKPLKL